MAAKDPNEEKETEETEETKETPETKETSEETTPEKETETSEETTETEPETETTEQEFDVEEFKKATVAEAQEAVMKKIAAGLGMTEQEKDEAQKELIPPWEQRGETKPKSWKEHAEYSADLAEWKRQKQEEEIKKTQAENEKEAKEVNKRWNDYWDTELEELVASGKIPEVKDGNDPNDPGKRARIKLFAKMQEIGVQRQNEGKPPITSVKLIFYEHYEDEEPSGANAPVSFGKKAVGTSSEGDYSYEDIHGKSVDQIKEEGKAKG